MKKENLYWVCIVVMLFISCTMSNEKFVVTEFSEESEKVAQNFFKQHQGRGYYWDTIHKKPIGSTEKVIIEYKKKRLKTIVSELGYDSQRKNMSQNPIISIYYNKENTTQAKAKSEIMDALFSKYKVNQVVDVQYEE